MTDVQNNLTTVNGNLADKGSSGLNKVTFRGGGSIEDDSDMEQPGLFTRGVSHDSQYNSGISSRLSTVIRRSLRLGPKRSLSSGNRSSSARFRQQPSFIEEKVSSLLHHIYLHLEQILFIKYYIFAGKSPFLLLFIYL